MPSPERFTSHALASLPIVNDFLERLRLKSFFEQFLPKGSSRLKLPYVHGVMLLLRSILLARGPLYGLQDWARGFDEERLGLPPGGAAVLNDDRVGRCLDQLFRAPRAALMTAVVLHAIKRFKIDLSELHNDSTTVTFCGEYPEATGQKRFDQQTHRITFGFNKDFRPDLKQLLWILSTSADGTVPIWCDLEHGNTTDDQTHIASWETLRQIVGRNDFLYVADSKLCTRENMQHIVERQGRFLTVLPATRTEVGQFYDWLQTHEPPWQEILRQKNPRRTSEEEDCYRGMESPMRTVEGYRVLWIHSSQKHALDRAKRHGCLARAVEALEQLQVRLASPRSRLKSRQQVEREIAELLSTARATRWLAVHIESEPQHRFNQAERGRPSARTHYVRQSRERFKISWQSNAENLNYDARTDGVFPLVLNDEHLSMHEALIAYKHQPQLEKRHEQFKTVFAIMPVNLKNHMRVEALLFIYFIALLLEALIERELRQKMKAAQIESLPLYHEGRRCMAPTAHLIFELFAPIRRYCLLDANGSPRLRQFDPLNEPQRQVLSLLGFSQKAYFGADGKGGPNPMN